MMKLKKYREMMEQIHPDEELVKKTKEAMQKQSSSFHVPKWKYAGVFAMIILIVAGVHLQHLRKDSGEMEISDAAPKAYEQVVNTTDFNPQYAIQLTQYKESDSTTNTRKEDDALSTFNATSSAYVLKEHENTIYSPLSASYALAMLYSGVDGDSKKELASMFQMSQVEIEQYLQNVYNTNQMEGLSIVNSFWFDDRFQVNQDTLQKIADIYYANSYSTDFSNQAAIHELNDYVFKESKEMIQADYKTDDTLAMKILNITALESKWVKRFISTDQEKEFTLADASTILYKPMVNTLEQPYYKKTDAYEMSDLYLENGCKLRVVLPNETTSLDTLIAKKGTLQDIMETTLTKNSGIQLHLEMPKFTIANTLDLQDYLHDAKVTSIFTPSKDLDAFGKDLYVSKVEQQANIEVNENGLKAAAKTDIGMTGVGGPNRQVELINMYVNRPFLYMVLSPNNDVLFIGTVYNPMK